MGRHTLLVGGARSGKSRTAARLAAASGGKVVVVATGEPGDEEMAERIRRHRADRPEDWLTIEEPLDLAGALRQAGPDAFVIIDCLTLWVANLLGQENTDDEIAEQAADAAALATNRAGDTTVVTNEVGMGVIPDNPLGRRYADLLGNVNSVWADAADRTFFMVAGRAVPTEALGG
jgi:adenosylcobinamide kinase / adenosylcobinamide-phosphate guanylyltransferase